MLLNMLDSVLNSEDKNKFEPFAESNHESVSNYRGGDIGGAGGAWAPPLSKAGGLSPPTFTDKNGAPPPILPVRGILVLTVSNVALVVHLLQS